MEDCYKGHNWSQEVFFFLVCKYCKFFIDMKMHFFPSITLTLLVRSYNAVADLCIFWRHIHILFCGFVLHHLLQLQHSTASSNVLCLMHVLICSEVSISDLVFLYHMGTWQNTGFWRSPINMATIKKKSDFWRLGFVILSDEHGKLFRWDFNSRPGVNNKRVYSCSCCFFLFLFYLFWLRKEPAG